MRRFCVRAVRGRSVVPTAGLAIVLCLALAAGALAAPGGIDVGFASGHSDTLQADGTSRTVLEVTLTSLSDACWGGEVSGPGKFSLLVSATKATVEPAVAVDVQFPAQLTVTAGKESGTAEVKVQASWCPEDAVGAFGVCSDQSRAQSKCEAQISIPIGDAAPPAEPAKPSDRDDDGVPDADDACPDQKGKPPDGCPDFEAVLGCTPQSPVAGQKLNCSVTVQGARPGEQLNYVWYVDSTEAARTTSPAWTWNSAVAGGHDIGVDVMGDARSLSKTVSVKVQTAATGDDDGDAVPDDKDACRGQYGEGADGCPKPKAGPVAPPSSTGSGTGGQDPPSGGTGEQPSGGGGGEPPAEGEVVPPAGRSDEEGEARSRALERLITVQQAKSPKVPAAGVAAGAAALEYIAAVLLNLRAGDRSAKQGTPAKEKEPAERRAAPSLPERSRPPIPGQAAGESAEERAKRGVRDVRNYAQALEQSRKSLQQLVGRVPKAVRESENWKTRVAPLLDKVNGWTDPTKVLDLVDRLEKTLNRRQEYEKSPAYRRLNEHQREMLVWLTRGVDVLTGAAEKAHEQYVIDPAKKVIDKIPGKPGAGTLEQHRKDSAGLFEEIRKAPPSTVRKVTGASQRNQGLEPLHPGDPFQTDDVFQQPSPPPRTRETKSDQIIRSVKEWWNRPGKLPLNR